jgi:hypothetical protein
MELWEKHRAYILMRFVESGVSVTDTTDPEPGSVVSVADRTDTR